MEEGQYIGACHGAATDNGAFSVCDVFDVFGMIDVFDVVDTLRRGNILVRDMALPLTIGNEVTARSRFKLAVTLRGVKSIF